ncbi:hypothetical protein GCM10009682_18110 [Luedemannella flava]|uniref:Uncharacterized protein n=1 Tax=Luedemannella flava TaxID=349316 RepID=A0ABN2LQR2_9ACTN
MERHQHRTDAYLHRQLTQAVPVGVRAGCPAPTAVFKALRIRRISRSGSVAPPTCCGATSARTASLKDASRWSTPRAWARASALANVVSRDWLFVIVLPEHDAPVIARESLGG